MVAIILLALLLHGLCIGDAQAPKNIFWLAGQSNMSGQGGTLNSNSSWDRVVPPESNPNPAIFQFALNFTWVEAQEPLHAGLDCGITCGVGPGMPFANTLLKFRPNMGSIGLVPLAHGGSHLSDWNKTSSFYTSLTLKARVAIKGGGMITALLWFQGESDANTLEEALTYKERFEEFIHRVRTDLSLPNLPVIQVAIVSGGPFKAIVRAQQFGVHIPNVQIVDALGSELEPDGLHLTTHSQVVLGEKMARAFLTR